MAPWGSVIKNGLLFALFSAGPLFLASFFFARGIIDVLYSVGVGVGSSGGVLDDWFRAGYQFIFIGLLFSITIVAIIFMKALSDTVEDGMVEF